MSSRREFLGSVGAAGLPAASTVDVLVVGGGTAGTIAAIQAGRMGARTVLVEAGSQLGGTMTTAGVDFPGLFHAWGKQIIAGIGWELVSAAVALNGDRMPDFSEPYGQAHWKHQVRVNGALYAALAEEACTRAGVALRYYETPVAVGRHRDGWRVRLVGKNCAREVTARRVVDATGDATVVAMMGFERRRESETQPGTLIYRLGGFDLRRADLGRMEREAAEAVESGRLERMDFRGNLRGFLGNGGENAMHVRGADSSSSERHTETNVKGRQSMLRMFRFLKPYAGFEGLRLERLQPEVGVRETYRIVGETVVTVDDYKTARRFEDAVSYAFYPIDLHDEHGVRPRQLARGKVPTVPLSALIPKGSRGVMVAGRSVSSDRLANSALRVQASSMAMGQAAGAASALAARGKGTVEVAAVREALRGAGAIVPV